MAVIHHDNLTFHAVTCWCQTCGRETHQCIAHDSDDPPDTTTAWCCKCLMPWSVGGKWSDRKTDNLAGPDNGE